MLTDPGIITFVYIFHLKINANQKYKKKKLQKVFVLYESY